eukprot:CAMPEP_0171169204 /NCGR_PEP_ID=MMETSP0790-20130122/8095_1 /TAXON_ID=2925 /ORGANISM="Alexandrium catenella, Strain OF101" /LENGTH=1128 /DNA_ID=CAMNT_0011634047 /DNA_START=66 /DNA_END=3452 /DNA_ORIENTATION=+
MAPFTAGPSRTGDLSLRGDWVGLDLAKVSGQPPRMYRRGDLAFLSGCITATSPMRKDQAGWHITVATVDPRSAPLRDVLFMAPTTMSRYEGVHQCGTSTTLKPDGRLQIYFSKNAIPMVLHFSGICFSASSGEPTPIEIVAAGCCDWQQQQQSTKPRGGLGPEEKSPALLAEDADPPALMRCGNIACLQGRLMEATFGTVSQRLGTLPEGLRPAREVRCLASLLQLADGGSGSCAGNSVAVTLRPDGAITVQGGKVHRIEQEGNVHVLQQNKRGCLCLDGVRFALRNGHPIEPSPHLTGAKTAGSTSVRTKLSYLMTDGRTEEAATAVIIKEGDLVMLEGHLSWALAEPPHEKRPLATLPRGCWPSCRQVFFTRGSIDIEERRRVDVDQYGRIFCPEGAPHGRVELTGVIFAAAEHQAPAPREPDWDDLKVGYDGKEVSVVSTSFDGHELLEQFVRCSNHYEWGLLHFDCSRSSAGKLLMPLPSGRALLGHHDRNPMNLSRMDADVRRRYKELSQDHHGGITVFHALLHVSNEVFDRLTGAQGIDMKEADRVHLKEQRRKLRIECSIKRRPGINLQELATEIVDQMFEHWDFKAQLQGALQNDRRAPQTIRHLFPNRGSGADRYIKDKVKPDEMARFEEARQFFSYHETTGNSMTHCSLMGSADTFTQTGKWYFPDDQQTQKKLFGHIAWLFDRNIHVYISERQTPRFPFIEDLDIQCKTDWNGPPPRGENGTPPDSLLIQKPQTDEKGSVFGDPGELMKHRAEAVHMVYPQFDHLDCLVYSASGYNKGKGMLKSSWHLVWPQLIVDSDRAPIIRHVTLGRFKSETNKKGSYLERLQTKLLELHESNNWELVFDKTTVNARNGLRMPYSDKASKVVRDEDKPKVKSGELSKTSARKVTVREERPSKAIGRIRFEFERDPRSRIPIGGLKSAQWDMDSASCGIAEWIEMGSCRREASRAELTPWQLSHEVLEMLPTKPGERLTFEGEADGEGGHWVTHRPLPMIRRCSLEVPDFRKQLNEALRDEQDTLMEEHHYERFKRIVGSWVWANKEQAIWRGSASVQCDGKDPNGLWGTKSIRRPTEVIYIVSKGKVLVDGPHDLVVLVVRLMKPWTQPDDVAVVPIYDVSRIS